MQPYWVLILWLETEFQCECDWWDNEFSAAGKDSVNATVVGFKKVCSSKYK